MECKCEKQAVWQKHQKDAQTFHIMKGSILILHEVVDLLTICKPDWISSMCLYGWLFDVPRVNAAHEYTRNMASAHNVCVKDNFYQSCYDDNNKEAI